MIGSLALEVRTAGPPQPLPPCVYAFPPADAANADGVVAGGGDFEPETVVAAYRAGAFPWPHPSQERLWFSPDPRAIIPMGGLHVSHRLARTIRSGRFRATVDAAFAAVIDGCADRPGGTWITPAVRTAYLRLHRLGWAHSVEAWTADGELAGGLYGLAVGAMFGAESMFYRITDGSKVAMVALMQHAGEIGVGLIDVQVLTDHTERMGAIDIPRSRYLRLLRTALTREAHWYV